ncbi:MAG: hypothetical protein A3B91_03690 [Candidatus Yanofskybacteria bacterium RIFCSPHIGHO2_02_FULL_41_29]|uniref:Uncharacterized protein n=1 Tax=Candidatus Yanofskybacteria bacterium RIFCSPHIGHO2_01_FULL_41_53 TaxID=1802663 RepID=A0A1F8EM10_9BACT|nr:MAG: hypothetical protein A2650_00655 [Candidatus Yanofskybacteria bacterium RIFCSPHIGHO2_01_FULL_41_53]OGN10860.1 MAG: hypothetical protein A3B91_03690 [Candidatus Yanofskybacteria bacterium RIFCSPHIGHO2_02_FULL_41_29]OGN18528.1 MAG: hypothetical protein A3F48_01125 [Candidatus Yanofskybacteria bacterium RIFCSPHIGHO2_12_FULL_41_9]OGN24477.1 MAG: hypothetical protein A2916_02490 [Candidatus Yanofskybacteria bacterium RIFCSPLOWO2_01_FULL_41_67]OGN29529.1 MAG: hypothetical protein A3H54_01330 
MSEISEKQIIANQQNALKSTGPTSDDGKSISKLNSLKHGILSKSSIITTGDGEEDLEMFEVITERLVEDFQPIGLAEEMLVDRIISSYWRLQRVMRAEVGEVRKLQDSHMINSITKRAEQENQHQKLIDIFRSKRFQASFGIQSLIGLVETAEDEVKSQGFISDETIDLIHNQFGEEGNNFAIMAATMNVMMKQEEIDGEPCLVPKEAAKEAFLKLVQEQKELFGSFLKNIEEKEHLEDESDLMAKSIPDDKTLEKLTRYEASLEKGLYRAIHELQRLQSLRRGERPPIPFAIDVDIGNDR